ncbi:MAG: NAD(+) synthase [Acholeplasmataceae bacterium]|nr:NAD(+) synthase [Acholeplasmataceae bacterium]
MYKHGYIKVAAVTPKISVGDIEFNKIEILKVLDQSRASLTVFPELTITGYSASDLFYQGSFIDQALQAVKYIKEQTTYQGIYIIGVPLDIYGVLYNCALVIQNGQVLGVIPKHYLPNHHEFYEKRWFHSGKDSSLNEIDLFNQKVPFGYLLFEDIDKHIRFGVEVCQDLWATYAPSDDMSLAGANLIFNLSASSEYVGKQSLRRHAVLDHSRKQMAAYVYTTSGHYESSSEIVYSSHKVIASLGELIAESHAFTDEETHLYADIDMMGINYQKRQDSTYRDMHLKNENKYQYIKININQMQDYKFEHKLNQTPFISTYNTKEDIKVANHLQIFALIKRLESIPKSANKIILGISGGLDSALALLVSHQAMIYLKRDPKDIIAVTMPAQVTSHTSKSAALELMEKLNVTSIEIPIASAVDLHLDSIAHKEKDVTYENTQARMRTMILMNLANKHGGFVLGTGDLSEIALGWMTYNGDQMSMYAINAGLPKTWVKLLIDYHAKHEYKHISKVLNHILDAPITPELKEDQDTEITIGRYDINDFMLFHHLINGADESKISWLVKEAFDLNDKDLEIYVNRFFKRFYTQQFKRQTLPEGPKILGISLSPRGEYRMPSDVKRK